MCLRARYSRPHVIARCVACRLQNFDALLEVKGVSAKVAKDMETQWSRVRGMRELVMYLQSLELPISLASKLAAAYSPAGALAILKSNPFSLVTSVRSVSCCINGGTCRCSVFDGP